MTKHFVLFIISLFMAVSLTSAQTQTEEFTYQGYLETSGLAVNSGCNFEFALFDVATGGTALQTLAPQKLDVIDGIFTARLAFDVIHFDGADRYLDIRVDCEFDGTYDPLGRQPLTSSPYALYALNAGSIDGLTGDDFWQTGGNAGTSPLIDWLGTSDDTAFELRVNSERVLRFEPNLTGPANIIAGHEDNTIQIGRGSVIAGGGDGFSANSVEGDYATIGGGRGNYIGANYIVIGGGQNNYASENYASISGGNQNEVFARASVIGGGDDNVIFDNYGTVSGGRRNRAGTDDNTSDANDPGDTTNSQFATVGGGETNFAEGAYTTIGGGGTNYASGDIATIAGGLGNFAQGIESFVGGGRNNGVFGNHGTIAGGSVSDSTSNPRPNRVYDDYGTVSGGGGNQVGTNEGMTQNTINATYGTIGGGFNNTASGGSSTIAGGRNNEALEFLASVGGGSFNQVLARYGTIGGGYRSNVFDATTSNIVFDEFGTIGGGGGNHAGLDDGAGTQDPTNARYATVSGGRDNTASGEYATVGGGRDNLARTNWSTVAGGLTNRAESLYDTVSGGQNNSAAGPHATIGGGRDNVVTGSGTIGGGNSNNSSGSSSTIGGGSLNAISGSGSTIAGGEQNAITANGATIAGGNFNVADGDGATIAGGSYNEATGDFNTISGGGSNSIARNTGDLVQFSVVGGGYSNRNSADYGTIAGGNNNRIDQRGTNAVIAGGRNNVAAGEDSTIGGGSSNITGGLFSTVSGGESNYTSGDWSTISGGSSNEVTGIYSTIPGGLENRVDGDYSFAAGRRAIVNGNGSFVWADSRNFDYLSISDNRFAVRATGGVAFVTGINSSTGAPTTGVQLASGGSSWAVLSDRNTKENFAPVDSQAVLAAVAEMPLTSWNYIAQEDEIRHMGVMAQDFYAAFGLGTDETRINTIDADGVALAAIQGLHTQVTDLRGTVTDLNAMVRLLMVTVVGLLVFVIAQEVRHRRAR